MTPIYSFGLTYIWRVKYYSARNGIVFTRQDVKANPAHDDGRL